MLNLIRKWRARRLNRAFRHTWPNSAAGYSEFSSLNDD